MDETERATEMYVADKTREDMTRKTRQGKIKTREDKSKTRQNKTKRVKTRQAYYNTR